MASAGGLTAVAAGLVSAAGLASVAGLASPVVCFPSATAGTLASPVLAAPASVVVGLAAGAAGRVHMLCLGGIVAGSVRSRSGGSPRHKEFITNLPWVVEHPQIICVHAGLDANAPTDMQLRILRQRDFTLNRPQWLCSKSFVESDPPADCPATVVSGHVRVPSVVMRPKRILLDTTGGTEGDLSAVLLPERKVITSAGEAVPVGAGAGETKPSWWKFW